MKTTNLWPGVQIVNKSGRKIVIQWKQLPDGTRMALLLGDNEQTVSGSDDELGFIGALLSAAPAIFSMAKKVAPGLVKKGMDLATRMLPGPAAKMLKGALAPAAKTAQKSVKRLAAGKSAQPAKIMPGQTAPLHFAPTPAARSNVRHLAQGAKIPPGYRTVLPVMKISEGAFVD